MGVAAYHRARPQLSQRLSVSLATARALLTPSYLPAPIRHLWVLGWSFWSSQLRGLPPWRQHPPPANTLGRVFVWSRRHRGFSCGLGLTHPMSPLSAGPSAAVGWGLSVPVLRSLLLYLALRAVTTTGDPGPRGASEPSSGSFLAEGLRTQAEEGGTAAASCWLPSGSHCRMRQGEGLSAQAIGWCVSLITDYRVRLGAWGWGGDVGFPSCPQGEHSLALRWASPLYPGSKQDSFLCMQGISIHGGSLPGKR